MDNHELYMRRCLQLALLGAGNTAPNPMVGAVLVHGGRIIGEGYHQKCGQAHAEVNCINSVAEEDKHLVRKSTIYVSLEPCAHFGKTPPCADLIIQQGIPKVVVGCRDPFEAVNGKGIEKLQNAGVEVIAGVLMQECQNLNKRFFTFYTKHRPYVLLKWAQTADGCMAGAGTERLLITNAITNKLVHRWRTEEAAILVGTNTAKLDNPALDNRLWAGKSPVRLVLDMQLQLPPTLQLFDGRHQTIVLNALKQEEAGNITYHKLTEGIDLIPQILDACCQRRMLSIMVEGGARLLQSFIDSGLWDEARVITNEALYIGDGLPAPRLQQLTHRYSEKILGDRVDYIER